MPAKQAPSPWSKYKSTIPSPCIIDKLVNRDTHVPCALSHFKYSAPNPHFVPQSDATKPHRLNGLTVTFLVWCFKSTFCALKSHSVPQSGAQNPHRLNGQTATLNRFTILTRNNAAWGASAPNPRCTCEPPPMSPRPWLMALTFRGRHECNITCCPGEHERDNGTGDKPPHVAQCLRRSCILSFNKTLLTMYLHSRKRAASGPCSGCAVPGPAETL